MAGEGEETKMALGRLSCGVRGIKAREAQCQGGSRTARKVRAGRLQPVGTGALCLGPDVTGGAVGAGDRGVGPKPPASHPGSASCWLDELGHVT